jgi:hypothetical protein
MESHQVDGTNDGQTRSTFNGNLILRSMNQVTNIVKELNCSLTAYVINVRNAHTGNQDGLELDGLSILVGIVPTHKPLSTSRNHLIQAT